MTGGKASVFSRLRRSSQNLVVKRRDNGLGQGHHRNHQTPTSSFLNLPQEVRDHIYRYVADASTLVLAPSRVKKNPSPASLLLTCRQTATEYQPVLLARATLVVQVVAYDFNTLIRVLKHQNESARAAIRANKDAWVILHLSHSLSRDERQRFSEWCTFCRDVATSTDCELPLKYDVHFTQNMRPPRPSNRYASVYEMRLDLLRGHLRWFSALYDETNSDGNALDEAQNVHADLSKTAECLVMGSNLAR